MPHRPCVSVLALLPTAVSFGLYLSTIVLFLGTTLAARLQRRRRAKREKAEAAHDANGRLRLARRGVKAREPSESRAHPRSTLASPSTRALRAPSDSIEAVPPTAPFVSVLKPLAGDDDELAENLESFAALEAPAASGFAGLEILLGVARADDPAANVARAFLRRHPNLDAKLILTNPNEATNPKVAQLIALERAARGELLVVSDSNVRVRPDAMRRLLAPLVARDAELVTSVFAGTGEKTLGAALENLQLGAVVLPGVAVSTLFSALGGAPLTIGKSMAMRRDALAALGGFAVVGNVLAEDHVLGRRFQEAGHRVRLSMDAVENRNVGCTFRRTYERHTRWSKLRRSLVPGLFAIEPVLQPLLVATIAALLTRTEVAALALLATAIVQTCLSLLCVRVARGHALPWRYAPLLEVVRTFVIFACWVRACASLTIAWRGHPFRLTSGSRIVALDESVVGAVNGVDRRNRIGADDAPDAGGAASVVSVSVAEITELSEVGDAGEAAEVGATVHARSALDDVERSGAVSGVRLIADRRGTDRVREGTCVTESAFLSSFPPSKRRRVSAA